MGRGDDGSYQESGTSSSLLPKWMGTKTLVVMGTVAATVIGGLTWWFWPRKPVEEEKNPYLKSTQEAAGWAARNPGKANLIGAGVLGTTVAATVLAQKMFAGKKSDTATEAQTGAGDKGKKWFSWCGKSADEADAKPPSEDPR